jgi:hypothetical protein
MSRNITTGMGLSLLGRNLTIAASGDINAGPRPAQFGAGPGRIEVTKRVKMIAGGNITMSCPECPIEAPALVQGRDIFLKGDNITEGVNASLLGRNLTIEASGDVDLGNFSNSVERFGGTASGDGPIQQHFTEAHCFGAKSRQESFAYSHAARRPQD